ncbi:MAG: cell division protein FtsX [Rhodobacteraceae bacterium]|nr:cell division protein FtsX [Paracoccaceae bacterium]
MGKLTGIIEDIRGDRKSDRVVPPSGFTTRLTAFTAAAMAFLAVFALALSLAAGRLADRWDAELARTSTVRISAPEGQMAAQSEAVLNVLRTTPGVETARVMSDEEQRKLLEPWFGPDLSLDSLPIPRLIEVIETGVGPDVEGLRLRLSAEAPGAVLDDHTRWRRPLVTAASRLRLMALLAIALIATSTAAMITLAAQSALAANGQVIQVLRLIGARDVFIARAFVRRFTIRSFFGACVGTGAAMLATLLLPPAAEEGAFLTGLGFQDFDWLLPLAIPVLVGIVAFWATRMAAFRTLARSM